MLNHLLPVEKILLFGHQLDLLHGAVVFVANRAPDPLTKLDRLDKTNIALSYREISLGQGQLGIRQHGGEKRPVPVHLLKNFQAKFGSSALQSDAESIPAGQQYAGLSPGEDPGNSAEVFDPPGLGASRRP